MNDAIQFKNNIAYMVTNPLGEIISQGWVENATAPRIKDEILRALTGPQSTSAGTLLSCNSMAFRTDGSTILGSFAQWYTGGTAYATRYSSGTYMTSVNFNATYTATANTTVKSICLMDKSLGIFYADPSPVGSFSFFYSTNVNMSVGSAGKIIVSWTINAV